MTATTPHSPSDAQGMAYRACCGRVYLGRRNQSARITAGAFISHIAEQREGRVHERSDSRAKTSLPYMVRIEFGEALMTIVPGK